MAGVRRILGVAPRPAAPATVPDMKAKFALGKSELVGLDAADIVQMAAGTLLTLRKSKTDQEGEGPERLVRSDHSGIGPRGVGVLFSTKPTRAQSSIPRDPPGSINSVR
jgi:hypothetical protein